MADGMTTIRIGGKLPRGLYDSLTGGSVAPGYPEGAGVWALEHRQGTASLTYSEEGVDEFGFEDRLRQAGVPFDRCNETDLDEEFNPYDLLAFRPGLGDVCGAFDGQGHGELAIAEVAMIIDDPELDPAGMIDRLRELGSVKIHQFLEEHPLPSLEVVEPEGLAM